MKIALSFVPPGGGEEDYHLEIEMPAPPQPGDYIRVLRPKERPYTCDFVVRRTWWTLEYPNDDLYGDANNPVAGTTVAIVAECEFALSPMSSESHKRACEAYKNRGKPLREFDDSTY